MRRRGYTLIELTVALAIGTVVGVAALSAFASFNQQRVRIERLTTGEDIAKIVVQYLVREAQRVGGSVLRPWQAVVVEQDPCRSECNDSCSGLPSVAGDRVTFAFLDEQAAQASCPIDSITESETGGVVTFLQVPEHGDACCNLLRYQTASNGTVSVDTIEPGALANEHAMLVRSGATAAEEIFRAVTYTGSGNTTTCEFPFVQSAQTVPLASSPPPPFTAFTSLSGLNGKAIPIKVATAYVGCATPDCASHPENRGLFVFSDRDGSDGGPLAISSGDDNVLVSPNVADLQVALGYDHDEDGEVLESEDGTGNDNFAGNVSPSPSACTRMTDTGAPANAAPDPRTLRMISIAVLSAVRVNDRTYQSVAALPGGNLYEATSVHLRPLRSKAGFRSLNLLE